MNTEVGQMNWTYFREEMSVDSKLLRLPLSLLENLQDSLIESSYFDSINQNIRPFPCLAKSSKKPLEEAKQQQ
jgi:hypothetical protein